MLLLTSENFRDELSVHNDILFKSSKVIIPRILRPEVMSKIHSSHLGIEACLRKARDSVFWPNVTGDVRDHVSQCSICAELQSQNPKEPMQGHHIPDRPWSRVAADQFKPHGKDYVVISDFIEVKMLEENTSSAVIEFLKEQFSRQTSWLPTIVHNLQVRNSSSSHTVGSLLLPSSSPIEWQSGSRSKSCQGFVSKSPEGQQRPLVSPA